MRFEEKEIKKMVKNEVNLATDILKHKFDLEKEMIVKEARHVDFEDKLALAIFIEGKMIEKFADFYGFDTREQKHEI
jgi:hypothetical protein